MFRNSGRSVKSQPGRVLRQDDEFRFVVDLAEDPLATGPLVRSTARNSNLIKALKELVVMHQVVFGDQFILTFFENSQGFFFF